MHQHHEVRIDASPDYVWAVLTDVDRWPEWAPPLREVAAVDGGPLVVGGGIRVRARHLPDRTWRVTEVRPHRGFTWSDSGTGSTSRLQVRIGPAEPSGTVVAFVLDRAGWVGSMVDRVTGTATSARLDEITEGLRRRCETGRHRTAG